MLTNNDGMLSKQQNLLGADFMEYRFSESNHYRTIQTFLDSKKDFIILGLCGKTGSGSSTIAHILQTPFAKLNLPRPGDTAGDTWEATEYRLCYTYAKKHWKSFFRIKSSALITAYILKEDSGQFLKFLEELIPAAVYSEKKKLIQTFTDSFFEGQMQFSLSELFQLDPDDSRYLSQWFSCDQVPKDGQNIDYSFTPNIREDPTILSSEERSFKDAKLTLESNEELPYLYHEKSFTVMLTTRNLCKMFWEHKRLRQQKSGFKNPLWICLLQKFVFEYLPEQTAMLWKNVANIEHGLEVVALQQLGNHLRISGKPYGKEFSEEGYVAVAADINDSIKLLSSYLARRKQWVKELPANRRAEYLAEQRSFVVVDSIKNPFESMYLKSRYTNYYLIGTYTEDHTRHERLREKQRYPNTYIEAIDIVEQQSAFQRRWKDAEKLQGKIDNMKERLGFQEVVELFQEIARNSEEGAISEKLKEVLRGYETFSKAVFQTPEELEQLISGMDWLVKHPEDLMRDSAKRAEFNLSSHVQAWRDNYEDVLSECGDMREMYEIAKVVLSTMRTVKETKLYEEIPFILQNVEGCLQGADIFINNETDNEQLILLKKKLLRYVSLIMNPGLLLPTPIERGMQIAYTAKLNSGCISRQVGAAITDDQYHLLSIGWNQQPETQLPCLYRDLCSLYYQWSPEAYSDFELDNQEKLQKSIRGPVTELLSLPECPLNEQGKMPAYCFKDLYNSITGIKNQVHPRSLHAEETAFLNLGQYSAKGGNLFTTSSPCELCAKKAMYMGIKKIYYIEPYAGLSFNHVLSIGPQKNRPEMLLFTGAVGRAYTQLYTPLMPQKDELAFWMGAKLDASLLGNIQKKIVKNAPKPSENSSESITATQAEIEERGEEHHDSVRFPCE